MKNNCLYYEKKTDDSTQNRPMNQKQTKNEASKAFVSMAIFEWSPRKNYPAILTQWSGRPLSSDKKFHRKSMLSLIEIAMCDLIPLKNWGEGIQGTNNSKT